MKNFKNKNTENHIKTLKNTKTVKQKNFKNT